MGVDVVLFQEGYEPPKDVAERIEVDPAPFYEKDPLKLGRRGKALSRCAIVKVSDRVKVDFQDDIRSSHPGCLPAAVVTPQDGKYHDWPFHVVSFCPEYETYHPSSGLKAPTVVDSSIHRIISDISILIGRKDTFRMIVAGDTTVMYDDDRCTSEYWKLRNSAVFDRMSAIGLPLIGRDNSPTYYHPRQKTATADRQFEYVFASKSMHDSVSARAMNSEEEWGPSDHCPDTDRCGLSNLRARLSVPGPSGWKIPKLNERIPCRSSSNRETSRFYWMVEAPVSTWAISGSGRRPTC